MGTKAFSLGFAGAAVAALLVGAGYAVGTQTFPTLGSSVTASGAGSKGEVEKIVRDYLVANPQILMEMQASLERQEQDMQAELQRDTIAEATDLIYYSKFDGIIGNPNGNVTVVEFFDYNCGFCKRAFDDMEQMVAADPELRFVLKELPILGADSQKAHLVSMAFRQLAPEKYAQFHEVLLVSGARATEGAAILAAVALGVDEAALRNEMKNPDIARAINETYDLASRLAITGTPSYVVGNEVVFGALGHAVLTEKVEQLRATN